MATALAPLPKKMTLAQRKREAMRNGMYILPKEEKDIKFFIPVPAAKLHSLGKRPHISYLRKSSEDKEKQTLSIPAQRKEITKAAQNKADVEITLEYWETFSATTFKNRPSFTSLLEFCRANRQPSEEPGTIWAWDYDRFSRQQIIVDGVHKPHTKAMLKMLLEFDECGWQWHFVKSPPMGYELGDLIMGLVKFEQAGGYSSKLSADIKRNKDLKTIGDEEHGGFWVGGTAPYPAVRKDYVTGRPLQELEWAQPDHGVVLDLNPEWYPYWLLAAKMIIDGKSPQAVAEHFNEIEAPLGPTMVQWNRKIIVRMLTNTALIGWPIYGQHLGEGQKYRARWGCLVDEKLFLQAMKKLQQRTRGNGQKTYNDPKPLLLSCPFCEVVFHSRRLPSGRRLYYHPSPKNASRSAAWKARAKEAGCKCFTLDAEDTEAAVFALIREERLSPNFRDRMREEWERQHHKEVLVGANAETAKARYDQAKLDYQRLQERLVKLDDEELVADLQPQLRAAKDLVNRRKAEWQASQQETVQVDDDWGAIEARFNEMDQLSRAFRDGSLEDRRRLFANWIDLIDVFPIELPAPHSRRAARFKGKRFAKRLAVSLKTRPDQMAEIEVSTRYRSTSEDSGKLMDSGSKSIYTAENHQLAKRLYYITLGCRY